MRMPSLVVRIADPVLKLQIEGISALKSLGVLPRPDVEVIYYFSTSKTGSEWLKRVFADRDIRRHSKTDLYRARWSHWLQSPIAPYTITTSLGSNVNSYRKVDKPRSYRTLYVHRDPRDILVSWYFSTRYSHTPSETIDRYRRELNALDTEAGLLRTYEILSETAFPAMRGWLGFDDPHLMFLGYEEIIADNYRGFRKIFDHFEWHVPRPVLEQVLERYSFRRQAKGRRPGQVDEKAHQRKGIAGDWKNHLTDALTERFEREQGDLLEAFGWAGRRKPAGEEPKQ